MGKLAEQLIEFRLGAYPYPCHRIATSFRDRAYI